MSASILETIAAHKRQEVAAAREAVSGLEIRRQALAAPSPRGFLAALQASGFAVIAEIKEASPSAGSIRAEVNPAALARAFVDGGADALSVLTDERFFQGSRRHLELARAAVEVPVLRKDFILEPYQVYESRAMGADAVLLMAVLLDRPSLHGLIALAWELELESLVEVHSEAEVEMAVAEGARIVGINNRDLRDFSIDLETTARLRPRIPPGVLVVSESGIAGADDVRRVRPFADAILVGTAAMHSADPAAFVASLKAAGGGGDFSNP